MAQVILDFGSGNTHKNDWFYLKRMLDELKAIDNGIHEIIIKHQLFRKSSKNIPLERETFVMAYNYAKELGYQTTSSVFDKESLDFLLQFDIPFVKIANNRDLDWLIGEIPRKIPVYVSHDVVKDYELDYIYNAPYSNVIPLHCISKYPAQIKDYLGMNTYAHKNISDHTTNFGLWYKYEPEIIEWHYKLEDSTGLDAGPFARTPKQLEEIL